MSLSPALVLVGAVAAGLSCFLSGMEAGVFALSPVRIRHWMRQGRARAGLLYNYLQHPEEFVWTILVGNTLANVIWLALLVAGLHRVSQGRPWVALGLFAVAACLFYGTCDLLPKMLFRAFPNRLCLSLVGLFRVVHLLLRPLVAPLRWSSGHVLRWVGGGAPAGRLFASREDLRSILQETNPALTSDERAMITRVLDLNTVRVGRLAIPAERVVSVPVSAPMGEVLALCRDRRLTRLPVWREEGGRRRVAGMLSLKALLYQPLPDHARTAGEFLTPALYLSEETPVEVALRKMQRSGQQLAVLLGPDSRETGVVSLQDILRFIFGEVTV